MNPDYNTPPLNPLPPVVWLLTLPIAAIEAALSLGARGLLGEPAAIGWRLDAIRDWGMFGQVLRWMIETRQAPPAELVRLVAYPFVHGSVTHALFVIVFLLALGKFVGEVFRGWAVLAVFFGSAVAGGIAYALLPGVEAPLFGGFPAAYGLIGAFTFILWTRLGAANANRAQAFTLIGFLLGFQLIFGLLFGGGSDWVADLAGFVAGFLLSFVVSPGGWRAVLRRLRQA